MGDGKANRATLTRSLGDYATRRRESLSIIISTKIHAMGLNSSHLSDLRFSGSFEFCSKNEQSTETLGAALGAVFEAGVVVALVGELGAGKTRLVQTIAAAMGVERRLVNSPTFILIQEYDARIPIYHFDAYRLHDTDEFLELGADELMDSDGVCLIEWANRVAGILPKDVLRIEIEITGTQSRLFHFTAAGPKSESVLARLRQNLTGPTS